MTKLARTMLWLSALLFAAFGAFLLIDPGGMEKLGLPLAVPRWRTEIRAFYGGLELGLAAFLALCLGSAPLRPSYLGVLGQLQMVLRQDARDFSQPAGLLRQQLVLRQSRVPVCFPGSGGWKVTFPISKGDTGLLIFCSRSIDRWLSEGGSVDPQDDRTHDLSDAVFVPGLTDFAHPIDPFKNDRLTIGKVGGTQIHLKPSGTQIGTDDASQLDWVPIGTPLKTFLTNLLTALNTLNLPVSGATAGPPAPGTFPVLPTILSASVEVKK